MVIVVVYHAFFFQFQKDVNKTIMARQTVNGVLKWSTHMSPLPLFHGKHDVHSIDNMWRVSKIITVVRVRRYKRSLTYVDLK